MDRKSEFLKTLKDERNGDCSESRDCDKLEGLRLEGNHTPEPKENGKQGCLQNGLSLPMVEEGEVLSHSLEAKHRLLKAMEWQEFPENDESYLPLTEDELKEFHMRTEQLRRMGLERMTSYKVVIPACSPHGEAVALQSVRTWTRKQASGRCQKMMPGSRTINAHS